MHAHIRMPFLSCAIAGLLGGASAHAAPFNVHVVDAGGFGGAGAPLFAAAGTIGPPISPTIPIWDGPVGFSGIAIAPTSALPSFPNCTPAGCTFTPTSFEGAYFISGGVASGIAPNGADGIFIMGLYGNFQSLFASDVLVQMDDAGGLDTLRFALDGGNGTATDGSYDLDQQYRLQSFPATDGSGEDYVELWIVEGLADPVGSFDGLAHLATGDAQLGKDWRGHLVLSNIGASGDDGVEVRLGEVRSSTLQLDIVPREQLGMDAQLDITTFGQLGSADDTELWRIELRPRTSAGNDTWGVRVDTSILQPQERRVDAFLDGMLVASVPAPADAPDPDYCDFCFCDEPIIVTPFENDETEGQCEASFEFASPTMVLLPDGNMVEADHVVFASSVQPLVPGFVSRAQVRAAAIPGLAIREETISTFPANQFKARGDVELTAKIDNLKLENIGMSGDDGFDARPTDELASFADGLYVEFQLIDLSAVGANVSAECVVEDSFGVFDNPVGGCMNTPQGVTAFVDYGDLPCDQVIVTLFCTDGPSITRVLDEGELFRVDQIPGEVVPQIEQLACVGDELLIFLNANARITFLDGSGETCEADAVSLEATSCTGPEGFSGELVSMNIRVQNMPELVVENVTVGPAPEPCPGDATGDGEVNVADLNEVLANFNTSQTPGENGDVDGDGDVDISDLNLVLANFGQSCA